VDKNHLSCKSGVTMNSTSIKSSQRTLKITLGAEASRATITVAAKSSKAKFSEHFTAVRNFPSGLRQLQSETGFRSTW